MRSMEDALLLRIFLGEEDMVGDEPLYRTIFEAAMKAGLAGGTALRAPMGFGISRSVRTGINIDAGAHQPIIVEIIDRPDRIEAFLPIIEPMIPSGMVTMEALKVRMIMPSQSASV